MAYLTPDELEEAALLEEQLQTAAKRLTEDHGWTEDDVLDAIEELYP